VTATDGDPDPISAGTAGDAAPWGGSSAAVGMAANPDGAHQVDRHGVDREAVQQVAVLDHAGRAAALDTEPATHPWHAPP